MFCMSNKTTQYFTLEQTIRNNGHRHLERAIAYASAQWPEYYYQGSMKKAKRNYAKADKFKIYPWQQEIIDRLSENVAEQVMYCNNGSKFIFIGLK